MEFPAIPIGTDPESGEPLVVRLGRSVPFIQRGEGGSDNTVSVPNDVLYEELDAAMAVQLLKDKAKGNEALGTHPETGEEIFALIGPYGPYVQVGERTEDNKKPKRASLPKGTSPSDVDLALALRLLSLPRTLGKHPESGEEVSAAIGRFGPYVKCEKEFRSLTADDDPYTVELPRALELLAQPKGRRNTKKVLATLGNHPESDKPVELCEGRYGPFVTDGSVNASIPKDADPKTVTLDQALDLLADAEKRKPAKKKPAKKKAKAKAKSKAKAKAKAKAKTKAKAKAKPKAAE
jgi:DNA topoisomerase I